MALDSKHPQYNEFLDAWLTMRHTYLGEMKVKAEGARYLPPTQSMVMDGMEPGMDGHKAYGRYKARAVFHDFVKEAVEQLIGVMHHKPATIELPDQMSEMLEHATPQGESLQMLLRRINEAQLTTGRIGLLGDIPRNPPAGERPLPYIATYAAETIINWDEGRSDDEHLPKLNLVVLDETESERKVTFEWETQTKYRVLMLDPRPGKPAGAEQGASGQDKSLELAETNPAGSYIAGVFRIGNGVGTNSFSLELMQAPSFMGRFAEEIPFTFINTKDIVSTPDTPPLLGLALISLAIYRGEADYRQNLHVQGQDTLVVCGGILQNEGADPNQAVRVGAGARIDLPTEGSAEYIGVSGEGLAEQREALQEDKKQAAAKGGQLLDTTSREKESGDALKTRVSAQTATLNQIALAGAFGLETELKKIATWIGADPNKVIVKPNLDFDNAPLTGADLVGYVTAKNQGAPIARETIHKLMRAKNITDLTFEEEMALIEGEAPITVGVTLPIDPNADPDDEGGGDDPE